MNNNPWHTLGVSRKASEDDIKRAYRKKAFRLHPDRNHAPNAELQFRELAEAYALLLDPERLRALESAEEETSKRQRDPGYHQQQTAEARKARRQEAREARQRAAIEQRWIFARQKRALRKSWLYYPLMALAWVGYLSIFVMAAVIASIPLLLSIRFNEPLVALTGFLIWPLCGLLIVRSSRYKREILVYFR